MAIGTFQPSVEVKNQGSMLGLFSTDDILSGQVIFKLEGEIIAQPTRTSLQIGMNEHIEDQRIAFTNHNCNPTAFVYDGYLITKRNIKAGDEITIDYNLTEEIVTHPFICNCCGRIITGKNSTLYRNLLLWIYLHSSLLISSAKKGSQLR